MPELAPIFLPDGGDFRRLREDLIPALRARRRAADAWARLSPAARVAVLHGAFVVWSARRPWCWLADRLQLRAFVLLGRRFADRWLIGELGEFRGRKAALREQLTRGMIDRAEFRRRSADAASAYNARIGGT